MQHAVNSSSAAVAPGHHLLPWLNSTAHARDQSAYWSARAQLLIVATTAIRCLFIATTDLTDTEAYYVSWSRFPSWSYYDHAPVVAWLVRAVGWFSSAPSAPRLVPLGCAALSSWMIYRLGERLFSPRAGFLAALTLVSSPAFFIIGALVNPEGPLAPMWLWCLLLLYDLGQKREAWRPILLGAAIGGAFLCKYTGVLLLPVVVGYVATTPSARGWLRRPSFYLGGVVALVVAIPVIGWNARRDWPTVHLHMGERMSPVGLAGLAQHAVHFVITQGFTFHPLLLPGLAAAFVWCLRRVRQGDRFRLVVLASAPVWVFLAAVMIRARDAESHWTMVAYLPLVVAAGGWIDLNLDQAGARLKLYLGTCLAGSAALIGISVVYIQFPGLAAVLPGYDPRADPLTETEGWDSLRAVLRERAAKLGPSVAIVGSHNVLCGHLLVALGDSPEVYCASPNRTEFDFIGRRQPPADAPVLYVGNQRYPLDPARQFPDRPCREVEAVEVQRGLLSVGRFRIAECLPIDRSLLAEGSSTGRSGPTGDGVGTSSTAAALVKL